jgi:hypothetical protein
MSNPVKPSSHPDVDEHKGVVEDDSAHPPGQSSTSQESMAGQLPHRNPGELANGSDSDFPEPGATPEHSGERK